MKVLLSRSASDPLDCAPLIHSALRTYPGRTFCHHEDGSRITFGELAGRIAAMQRWLHTRGIRADDRVAVMMGNNLNHMALIFALILSGVIWVPVNTKLKADGLRHVLDQSKPALLVADPSLAETIAPAMSSGMGDTALAWRSELPAPDANNTLPVRVASKPSDTLAVIFTSGTTGPPKGVLFSHRMLRVATEAALLVSDARDGDRMLFWEPLCHVGGAQMLLMPFLMEIDLYPVERFSARKFWAQLAVSKATHLHYLGGILDILQQTPGEAPALPHLRVVWGAGASLPVWNFIRSRFGIDLRECYGMTECSSFATVNATGTPLSIGTPMPWIDLQLLDAEGREVAHGEAGEMVLASRLPGALTAGYLDDERATAAALRGGKLHTGDLARREANGALAFVGRRTDSMRVRGENVSAWEVERAFATHPGIEASAAVGVASPVGEQDILLYVKPRHGVALDLASLRTWAAHSLAPFQLPRYFKQIDAFVTTPSERIRKQFLPRDPSGAWDSAA